MCLELCYIICIYYSLESIDSGLLGALIVCTAQSVSNTRKPSILPGIDASQTIYGEGLAF